MQNIKRVGKIMICLVMLGLPSILWAGSALPLEPPVDHWRIQFGLGGGNYSDGADGVVFQVTSVEYDSLLQQRSTRGLFYFLSFQYLVPFNGLFSAIGFGPTLYYQRGNFSGRVFQFNSPKLNNYTYQLEVKPINLYAEADLYFRKLFNDRVTFYTFLGIGSSIVKLSYSEQVVPAALTIAVPTNSVVPATSDWDCAIAFEVGVGFNIDFGQFFFGGRYAYQRSRRLKLAIPGVINDFVIHELDSHSTYGVLGYRFG